MKQFTLTSKRSLRYAFIGLMGLSLFSSCKKDDPYDFKDTVTANVNLINASADAPAAQLYVEGIVRTPTAVTYGNASGYNKTFLGDQNVEIKSDNGSATLSSSHVQFDANNSYTFFLVGQNANLGMITVTDDLSVPSAGKARIRFVNTTPNGTAVTLNSGSTVLVAGLSFRGIGPSTEMSPGSYNLTAVSGTARSATLTLNIESGKIYTIYSKGMVGGSGNAAFSLGAFTNK